MCSSGQPSASYYKTRLKLKRTWQPTPHFVSYYTTTDKVGFWQRLCTVVEVASGKEQAQMCSYTTEIHLMILAIPVYVTSSPHKYSGHV